MSGVTNHSIFKTTNVFQEKLFIGEPVRKGSFVLKPAYVEFRILSYLELAYYGISRESTKLE